MCATLTGAASLRLQLFRSGASTVSSTSLVDVITWSYPFQSYFLDVWVSVVEKLSQTNGTEPDYWYLFLILKSFGPLVLLA